MSISHIRQLFGLKTENEINYYVQQINKRNLSKRELENIIKNKEYERIPNDTKNKLLTNEQVEVKDLIQNPILIKNKNNNL